MKLITCLFVALFCSNLFASLYTKVGTLHEQMTHKLSEQVFFTKVTKFYGFQPKKWVARTLEQVDGIKKFDFQELKVNRTVNYKWAKINKTLFPKSNSAPSFCFRFNALYRYLNSPLSYDQKVQFTNACRLLTKKLFAPVIKSNYDSHSMVIFRGETIQRFKYIDYIFGNADINQTIIFRFQVNGP